MRRVGFVQQCFVVAHLGLLNLCLNGRNMVRGLSTFAVGMGWRERAAKACSCDVSHLGRGAVRGPRLVDRSVIGWIGEQRYGI